VKKPILSTASITSIETASNSDNWDSGQFSCVTWRSLSALAV